MKKHRLERYLLHTFLTAGILIFSVFSLQATGTIGRTVKVVSLCFPNKGLDEIAKIVDEEGAKGSDIILLPETWQGQSHPETLEGKTITTLSKLAQKHNTYILSPIDRTDGKNRYNSAVLIDRKGKVVFVYDKVYPYWGEYDLTPPVTPGKGGDMIYDTDFGRIGVAICYDANFPEVWQVLRDKGAEIVCWPSAYSAGIQLQAYALLHHYYIVTSTQTRDCQVYDISSGDITIARATLDLDRRIYHENFNLEKLDKLLRAHGDEIEKEISLPREQWFVLRATKPEVSARLLAKEYGMEELAKYQDRSRSEIDKKRNFDFMKR